MMKVTRAGGLEKGLKTGRIDMSRKGLQKLQRQSAKKTEEVRISKIALTAVKEEKTINEAALAKRVEDDKAAKIALKLEASNELDTTLAFMSIRWSGEVVAEKACLLCAGAIVAMLYGGGGGSDAEGIQSAPGGERAVMCAIFMGIELVVDYAFVYVTVEYMDLPILRVTQNEELGSKEHVLDTIVLGLTFACVALMIVSCFEIDLR